MVEEMVEAEETSPRYFKSYNWCPVCGKSLHEDFDYCPMHKGVLTLKVYSYKPKVVELPMVGVYDVGYDDFGLDEGVSKADQLFNVLSDEDKNLLKSAGLDSNQFYKLFKSQYGKHPADYPHPAPTIAHEEPPASPPEPEIAQVKPNSSWHTPVKSYTIKVMEDADQPKSYSIRIKKAEN